MSIRHWCLLIGSAALGLLAGWLVQHGLPGSTDGQQSPVDSEVAAAVDAAGGGSAGRADSLLGQRRPDFAMPGLDGERIDVGRFDGDILVINFWATWCPPCVEEVPMLIELQADLGDAGVQVFGVAVEPPEPVRDFAAEFGIDYPLVADRREGFAIAAEYGNPQGLMPYTVFVDREGTIRGVHQGLLSREQAEQHLAAMLETGQ